MNTCVKAAAAAAAAASAAYLEHLVRLVKHQDLEVPQRQLPPADPPVQRAVCADDHLLREVVSPGTSKTDLEVLQMVNHSRCHCFAMRVLHLGPSKKQLSNHMVPHLGASVLPDAVEVEVMDVYLPMRSRTCRFWTTNSRVGQMHSACAEWVYIDWKTVAKAQ